MPFSNLVFHIGLHKTATSFLQANVFPRLSGIDYMPWRNLEYFLRLDDKRRYLVSCEGLSGHTFASREDREKAISLLGQMFPDARVVVIFRPQGDFIASLYSQYLRYGGVLPIEAFFQLSRGSQSTLESGPLIDPASIDYPMIIQDIETHFRYPPMVVIMAEMFKNPRVFLTDLCEYAGCQADDRTLAEFAKKPINTSLKRWHGNSLIRINKAACVQVSLDGRNRPFSRLQRLGLSPAEIFLEKLDFIPSGPLVDGATKARINSYFAGAWDHVREYAAARKWRQ